MNERTRAWSGASTMRNSECSPSTTASPWMWTPCCLAFARLKWFRSDEPANGSLAGHLSSSCWWRMMNRAMTSLSVFDWLLLFVPFEHSAREVRHLLKAEAGEHRGGGGAANSSAADGDDSLVFVRRELL